MDNDFEMKLLDAVKVRTGVVVKADISPAVGILMPYQPNPEEIVEFNKDKQAFADFARRCVVLTNVTIK